MTAATPSFRPVTPMGRAHVHTEWCVPIQGLGRGVPFFIPLSDIGRLCVEAGVPSPKPFIDVGLRLLGSRGFALDTIQLRHHGGCRLTAFSNLLLHPFEFVRSEIDREHHAFLAAF